MKLEAVVNIEGDAAHFHVSPRAPGMYQAELVRFTGRPDTAPPSRIILVRGVRQWAGSCDNEVLLNQLGQAIEGAVADAPIFKKERDRGRSTSPEKKENR